MFDILRSGLKKASELGARAEIYGERGDILSIELERGKVKKVKHVKSTGIGVRVLISKKIGFSYTTRLGDAEIEGCVVHAVKQARISEEDPHLRGFPGIQQHYRSPEKTFDPEIVELLTGDVEDAIGYSMEMLSGMEDYNRKERITITMPEGSFAAAHDETYIVNSEGVEISDTGTYVSAGLTVVAGEGDGEECSGSEGKVSRVLKDMDFRWLGSEAVRIAVESLGGSRVETKELPVVLSPRALQSLMGYTLIPELSAEHVQRKESPYYGKKGTEIASESLSIIDDGTMPMGVNSRRMDGEGVPSQSTTLVENGVLRNFMYDFYTACKEGEGVASTGNAIRSYDNLPVPGATNFIINASDEATASKDEILADIREGLFIQDVIGAHTASRASGDFSVVAQNAWGIKNGELSPVKQVMLVGNMQDLLRGVELLATDTRQIYNVVSPSIKVSKLQVVS